MNQRKERSKINRYNNDGKNNSSRPNDIYTEKVLLNLEEVCKYTGWGKTKTREILRRKDSTFTVWMGNRLYVHKKLFDDYLEKCAKYQIKI